MKSSWKELCISLAGCTQAIAQVEKIATTGYVQSDDLETAVKSLFVTSPDETIEVYGSVERLLNGLEALQDLLINYREKENADKLRYVLGVLHIQKKLMRRREALNVIASRLQQAQHQCEHFGPSHDNVIRNIADIYSDTISKFQYRIQVSGNYNYLQQERVAAQVRSLLLAAIRSAMLWRQLGGHRWHLLVYRKSMLAACETLIDEAKTAHHKG